MIVLVAKNNGSDITILITKYLQTQVACIKQTLKNILEKDLYLE